MIHGTPQRAGWESRPREVREASAHTMPWRRTQYAELTVSQLRTLCMQHDLDTDGLKGTLVKRLSDHDMQVSPPPGPVLRARVMQFSMSGRVTVPQEALVTRIAAERWLETMRARVQGRN